MKKYRALANQALLIFVLALSFACQYENTTHHSGETSPEQEQPQTEPDKQKPFRVVKLNFGEGFHSYVDLLERVTDRKLFVLKKAKPGAEHAEALRKELEERAPKWVELKLLPEDFEIFWENDDRKALIKSFVEGHSLGDLMGGTSFWQADSEEKKKLIDLFVSLAKRGYFVGDLSTENLLYNKNNKRWYAIDTSIITGSLTPENALQKFVSRGDQNSIYNKWQYTLHRQFAKTGNFSLIWGKALNLIETIKNQNVDL